MKKFVFSNESYLKIKNDEHERLKRELENADRDIEALDGAILHNDEKVREESERQERDCAQGVTVDTLMMYQNFFLFMREDRKKLARAREKRMAEREETQQTLFKVHNQIRVLEEMKEEQYAEYMKEAAKEEAKDLDTVLSFSIHESAM